MFTSSVIWPAGYNSFGSPSCFSPANFNRFVIAYKWNLAARHGAFLTALVCAIHCRLGPAGPCCFNARLSSPSCLPVHSRCGARALLRLLAFLPFIALLRHRAPALRPLEPLDLLLLALQAVLLFRRCSFELFQSASCLFPRPPAGVNCFLYALYRTCTGYSLITSVSSFRFFAG